MADLSTIYMGIPLKNPIIAGASGMTASMDSIRSLEAAGVAALVTKSLFEEQIQLEQVKFDEDAEKYNYRHPEMITVAPHLRFGGAAEHLLWVKKTKAEVRIPVIASLNAINKDTWIDYAKRLEQTGVDGLECNLFAAPHDSHRSATAVEDEQIAIVGDVKNAVSIPVSVKLSFFYTNPLNVVQRLADTGADAFVLFNRLFEPDLDIDRETPISPFNLSHATDYRLPLRYAALLEGTIKADICGSTGIFSGATMVKMLLAGASAVQVVSSVYAQGYDHVGAMLKDAGAWMDAKGYSSLADIRGRMSRRHCNRPGAYTRAQYARLLMNPDEMLRNIPAV